MSLQDDMSGMRRLAAVLALASTLGLVGCATAPGANPRDPLEPMNRSIHQFNETVDAAVLKPVATAYNTAVPQLLRTGVSNFFGNLTDMWSFVNNLLQFKGAAAADTFFRVNVNTLMGLGGVLDIASEMGIEQHREDFGQTLGYWGVPPGPYLVLPLLGPSTLRDTAALRVETLGSPVWGLDHVPTRNSLVVLDVVDRRAGLLRAGRLLDEAALDKYSFTRDAFLQKRRNDVHDGAPPDEDEPEESDAAPATSR